MRKPGDQPARRADPPTRQAGGAGRIATSLVAQQTTVQFSGPLPGPQTLQGYEQILPGAAERIMALAERQAAHRMQTGSDDAAHRARLESKISDAAIRSETWDQRRSRELRCPAGWHTALRRHAVARARLYAGLSSPASASSSARRARKNSVVCITGIGKLVATASVSRCFRSSVTTTAALAL
jgi:hypothetical protein